MQVQTNGGKKKNYNESDFRMFYKMFHNRVYQTAYFILNDNHLAYDVLQETFIKAFKKINSISESDNIEAWLSVIATRTAIDTIRKNNNWNGFPTENNQLLSTLDKDKIVMPIEEEIESNLLKDTLISRIKELHIKYQYILILKYYHEFTDKEISEFLEISIGTVKSRHYRAKKKLQLILKNESSLWDWRFASV